MAALGVQVKNKEKDPKRAVVKLKNLDKRVHDVEEVHDSLMKQEIQKLCNSYARELLVAKGIADTDNSADSRSTYREAYLTLYREFDRIVGDSLRRAGSSLSDIGCGYGSTNTEGAYVDAIKTAGLLTHLHTIAKSLFSNTPAARYMLARVSNR